MLDVLLGFIFDVLLSAVGTVIVKMFAVDNAAEVTTVVIGLGLIAIGFAVTVWGL